MKSNNLTYKNDFDLLVADPFVYRWLGKYYLFGTGNYCPIYESSDLINWSYLGTAIPPNENNVDVLGCYAPEVVYFGGLFYLIYSPKGNEHRIYCSKDLTCNYTACDNVFEGIDGSFFVEKNGVTIFRSADVKGINPDGIYYKTSPSVKDFDRVGWKRIPSAYLNGWTEGPFLFERKDYKYLTYTGNHYLSEGYRVDYVSGLNSDYSSYNEGDTILISTDKEYNGLGHSATVIGPNLDSLIITYHNLLPGKKGRHYNFSTLITDENRLFCNGLCNYSSSVPLKPDFESRGINLFRTDTNKLTIPVLVDGLCTAELSFRHHKENFLYFGNYTLSLSNGIAKLFNNKDSYTSSYTTLPENCVIVVRIVNGDGQLKIYVNSQEVFNVNGYIKGTVAYGINCMPLHTALTLDAFGSSDKKLLKNIPSKFPATSCLEQAEIIKRNNKNFIIASNVSYNLNVGVKGEYYLQLTTYSPTGGEIDVTIGKKTYKTLVAINENLITALKVKLPKGKVKLTLNSDSVLVADVNFVKAEATANSFTKLSLATIFKEDNLSVAGGELTYSQSKYQVLNGKVTFSVEETEKYCGGITIRENHFAHFNNHPTESFYGYLVSVFDNKLRFYKAKYGKTLLVEFPVKEGEITVEFNNEKFDFYNEKGKLIGSYSDKEPYLYGYIGVLSLKGLKLKSFKFEK